MIFFKKIQFFKQPILNGFQTSIRFFLKTIFSNGFDSILKVIWLSFLEYYHRDRFGKSSGWQTSTGVVLPIRMLPAIMILLNTFIDMRTHLTNLHLYDFGN
jgi:hypothetical protein